MRSSILIRVGDVWEKKNKSEKSIWEFRHLTFQEYLAAKALLDGRYPSRSKLVSLAETVANLAGSMESVKNNGIEDMQVPESWREALRLLVADCKDDDVDDVLLAILNTLSGEDSSKTARPRSVLAALCLVDEPNVDEKNAQLILTKFASNVAKDDGTGHVRTSLDRTAIEVVGSIVLVI